jgi:hypothetical protein
MRGCLAALSEVLRTALLNNCLPIEGELICPGSFEEIQMRKPALTTCFCGFVILSASAHAEQVEVYGIGAGNSKSCADFVVASSDVKPGVARQTTISGGRLVSENKEYLEWAYGYISGANSVIAQATPKHLHQIKRLSAAGIDLWLRNYCNMNPNASFADAVNAFIEIEAVE